MSKKKRIINYKKFSIACLVLIIAIFLIAFGIKKISSKVISNIEDVKNIETTAKQVVIPEDKTINLIAIGDVMCHNTNFQTAYNSSTKTYDFMPAFVNVLVLFTNAFFSLTQESQVPQCLFFVL